MGNSSKGIYYSQFSLRRTHRVNKKKWGNRLRSPHPKSWGYYRQICNALGKKP